MTLLLNVSLIYFLYQAVDQLFKIPKKVVETLLKTSSSFEKTIHPNIKKKIPMENSLKHGHEG